MQTLEELKAPLLDEDGSIPFERIPELIAAIEADLEGSAGVRGITYEDHLKMMESHFAEMIGFLIQQMASIHVEVQMLGDVLARSLSGVDGPTRTPDPNDLMREFINDAMVAVRFDRLARVHSLALEKQTPKLVVPR